MAMMIEASLPDATTLRLLAGAQFADAFSTTVDGQSLTARQAAERMFANPPPWITGLMRLRDLVMTPFGLKTERDARSFTNKIGIFPVVSETPERIVAGFDDKHLDFRVVIDVTGVGARQRVTTSTVVLTHNWLGRTYLRTILPFHRMIARALLRQAVS
jgi:hypothetical protein